MADFGGQLRSAFPVEPIPKLVCDKKYPCDPDRADATLLQGIAWTEVAPDFWRDHWWGMTSLLPEAFVYYLPSLLEVSVTDDVSYDLARGSLIYMLDTSADPATIPHFTWDRMLMLTAAKFECLETWCGIVGANGWFHDRLQQERVDLTVMVVKEQAANPPARP